MKRILALSIIVLGILATKSALATLPEDLVRALRNNTSAFSYHFSGNEALQTESLVHEVLLQTYQDLPLLSEEAQSLKHVVEKLLSKKNIRSSLFVRNSSSEPKNAEAEIVQTILSNRASDCYSDNPLYSIKAPVEKLAEDLKQVSLDSNKKESNKLPPKITVASLFNELIVVNPDKETYEGWVPSGLENSKIPYWIQTAERKKRLNFIQASHVEVNIPAENLKPIRITHETSKFFEGIHKDIPLDGSKVGIKYTFFPEAMMNPAKYSEIGNPISFFLVKDAREFSDSELMSVPTKEQISEFYLKYSNQAKRNHELGEKYHSMGGRALKQNPKLASKYFKAGADKGHVDSTYVMGQLILKGIGVKRNVDKGIKLLEIASKSEGLGTVQMLGQIALEAGQEFKGTDKEQDYLKIARGAFETAAKDLHDAQSQNQYGFMIYSGIGGPEDENEGINWWAKSAQQGNQAALNNLLKVARRGKSRAQFALIQVLRPENPSKARELAIVFAKEGNPSVLNLAGVILYKGEGGPPNLDQAVYYFNEAAEKNYQQSLDNLKSIAEGGHGLALAFYAKSLFRLGGESNLLEARRLFSMASTQVSMEYAAEHHLPEIIRLRLERGEKADPAKEEPITPLLLAAMNGDFEGVDLLLNHGAAVNRAHTTGATALYFASQNGHDKVVDLLLKSKPNVDSVISETGNSALFMAALDGHAQVVSLLLENGAKVDLSNYAGATPLMGAAQNGHLKIVELLVQKGAKIDASTPDIGATPLFMAVQNGRAEVVKFLIEHGANPNQTKKNGVSPLMIAAGSGRKDLVEELLKAPGINTMLLFQGKSAVEFALENGHSEIEKIIQRHSGR